MEGEVAKLAKSQFHANGTLGISPDTFCTVALEDKRAWSSFQLGHQRKVDQACPVLTDVDSSSVTKLYFTERYPKEVLL